MIQHGLQPSVARQTTYVSWANVTYPGSLHRRWPIVVNERMSIVMNNRTSVRDGNEQRNSVKKKPDISKETESEWPEGIERAYKSCPTFAYRRSISAYSGLNVVIRWKLGALVAPWQRLPDWVVIEAHAYAYYKQIWHNTVHTCRCCRLVLNKCSIWRMGCVRGMLLIGTSYVCMYVHARATVTLISYVSHRSLRVRH